MPVALVAMSHSPLLEYTNPPQDVKEAVEESFAAVKKFVKDFDPDLIVNFGPDHYNGFFQDLAPHYCVGLAAHGTGDYDSFDGELNVPSDLAEELAAHIVKGGIDIATSRKMEVDHGAVQPAEIIYDGDPTAKPLIPIFVNALVRPFCEIERVRRMGALVGEFFKNSDKKVLFIGSGGLSHDPPVPRYHEATEEQKAFLVSGRNPTPEQRAARQARTIATAEAFAKGEADIMELNPEWDMGFLDICRSGDVEKFDEYDIDEMEQAAGHSVHEVRTWVAAYSALRACGEYELAYEFYKPIKEYIAGFAVTAAKLK